jgi:hypothetical protein
VCHTTKRFLIIFRPNVFLHDIQTELIAVTRRETEIYDPQQSGSHEVDSIHSRHDRELFRKCSFAENYFPRKSKIAGQKQKRKLERHYDGER